jgi:formylmethanofuran dehydrogenase subunit E
MIPRDQRNIAYCIMLFLCLWLSELLTSHAQAQILGGPASQLERAKEFSGHSGPYLAVGLRMGERALKRLGCEKHRGMTIQAECIPRAPYCFLVDGLQLSTGCTMGNRTIEFIPSSRIRVVLTNASTGEKVTYVLAEGLRTLIEEWSKTWKSDETVALLIYSVPSESLLFRETK